MKRIASLLKTAAIAGVALFSAAGANAQLLWRVTSPSSQKTSYIFGTHHIAPKSVIETTPGLTAAIDSAEKIYGEIDLNPEAQARLQQTLMASAFAPADSTISRVISPAALARLDSIMSSLTAGQLHASQLEPLKPSMAATQLAILQQLKAFPDYNPAEQLDTEIQRIFLRSGKPTAGLETDRQQVDMLFGAPISAQARELEKSLDNFDASVEAVPQLAQAYLAGDLDTLLKLVTDPVIGMDADEQKRLINDRNEAWAQMLAGALPTASLLIVVGAGHLPGPKGLLSLLRRDGFTVEPVTE